MSSDKQTGANLTPRDFLDCYLQMTEDDLKSLAWVPHGDVVYIHHDLDEIEEVCALPRITMEKDQKKHVEHFIKVFSSQKSEEQKVILRVYDKVLWKRACEIKSGWNVIVTFDSNSTLRALCFLRRLIATNVPFSMDVK